MGKHKKGSHGDRPEVQRDDTVNQTVGSLPMATMDLSRKEAGIGFVIALPEGKKGEDEISTIISFNREKIFPSLLKKFTKPTQHTIPYSFYNPPIPNEISFFYRQFKQHLSQHLKVLCDNNPNIYSGVIQSINYRERNKIIMELNCLLLKELAGNDNLHSLPQLDASLTLSNACLLETLVPIIATIREVKKDIKSSINAPCFLTTDGQSLASEEEQASFRNKLIRSMPGLEELIKDDAEAFARIFKSLVLSATSMTLLAPVHQLVKETLFRIYEVMNLRCILFIDGVTSISEEVLQSFVDKVYLEMVIGEHGLNPSIANLEPLLSYPKTIDQQSSSDQDALWTKKSTTYNELFTLQLIEKAANDYFKANEEACKANSENFLERTKIYVRCLKSMIYSERVLATSKEKARGILSNWHHQYSSFFIEEGELSPEEYITITSPEHLIDVVLEIAKAHQLEIKTITSTASDSSYSLFVLLSLIKEYPQIFLSLLNKEYFNSKSLLVNSLALAEELLNKKDPSEFWLNFQSTVTQNIDALYPANKEPYYCSMDLTRQYIFTRFNQHMLTRPTLSDFSKDYLIPFLEKEPSSLAELGAMVFQPISMKVVLFEAYKNSVCSLFSATSNHQEVALLIQLEFLCYQRTILHAFNLLKQYVYYYCNKPNGVELFIKQCAPLVRDVDRLMDTDLVILQAQCYIYERQLDKAEQYLKLVMRYLKDFISYPSTYSMQYVFMALSYIHFLRNEYPQAQQLFSMATSLLSSNGKTKNYQFEQRLRDILLKQYEQHFKIEWRDFSQDEIAQYIKQHALSSELKSEGYLWLIHCIQKIFTEHKLTPRLFETLDKEVLDYLREPSNREYDNYLRVYRANVSNVMHQLEESLPSSSETLKKARLVPIVLLDKYDPFFNSGEDLLIDQYKAERISRQHSKFHSSFYKPFSRLIKQDPINITEAFALLEKTFSHDISLPSFQAAQLLFSFTENITHAGLLIALSYRSFLLGIEGLKEEVKSYTDSKKFKKWMENNYFGKGKDASLSIKEKQDKIKAHVLKEKESTLNQMTQRLAKACMFLQHDVHAYHLYTEILKKLRAEGCMEEDIAGVLPGKEYDDVPAIMKLVEQSLPELYAILKESTTRSEEEEVINNQANYVAFFQKFVMPGSVFWQEIAQKIEKEVEKLQLQQEEEKRRIEQKRQEQRAKALEEEQRAKVLEEERRAKALEEERRAKALEEERRCQEEAEQRLAEEQRQQEALKGAVRRIDSLPTHVEQTDEVKRKDSPQVKSAPPAEKPQQRSKFRSVISTSRQSAQKRVPNINDPSVFPSLGNGSRGKPDEVGGAENVRAPRATAEPVVRAVAGVSEVNAGTIDSSSLTKTPTPTIEQATIASAINQSSASSVSVLTGAKPKDVMRAAAVITSVPQSLASEGATSATSSGGATTSKQQSSRKSTRFSRRRGSFFLAQEGSESFIPKSEQMVPQQMVPQQMVPQQMMPQQMMPQQMMRQWGAAGAYSAMHGWKAPVYASASQQVLYPPYFYVPPPIKPTASMVVHPALRQHSLFVVRSAPIAENRHEACAEAYQKALISIRQKETRAVNQFKLINHWLHKTKNYTVCPFIKLSKRQREELDAIKNKFSNLIVPAFLSSPGGCNVAIANFEAWLEKDQDWWGKVILNEFPDTFLPIILGMMKTYHTVEESTRLERVFNEHEAALINKIKKLYPETEDDPQQWPETVNKELVGLFNDTLVFDNWKGALVGLIEAKKELEAQQQRVNALDEADCPYAKNALIVFNRYHLAIESKIAMLYLMYEPSFPQRERQESQEEVGYAELITKWQQKAESIIKTVEALKFANSLSAEEIWQACMDDIDSAIRHTKALTALLTHVESSMKLESLCTQLGRIHQQFINLGALATHYRQEQLQQMSSASSVRRR